MPKREDEYHASAHPPYCTCVACCSRRARRAEEDAKRSQEDVRASPAGKNAFCLNKDGSGECSGSKKGEKESSLKGAGKPESVKTEGRAWFGNQYFDARTRRWRSASLSASNRLVLLVAGLLGALFFYLSLFPIVASTRNQALFLSWWNSVWAFGDLTDYVRAGFVFISGFIFVRGFLGLLIALVKTQAATKYMLWGGIAGLAFILAMSSGMLDGSFRMQMAASLFGGGHSLNQSLTWEPSLLGLNLPLIRQVLGLGWVKLSIIGCLIWIIGTLPLTNWWRRLN